MKKIDMEHLSSKERADAKNEVAVLRVLKHPNIIAHHESFVHDSELCIVMEYADGGVYTDVLALFWVAGSWCCDCDCGA